MLSFMFFTTMFKFKLSSINASYLFVGWVQDKSFNKLKSSERMLYNFQSSESILGVSSRLQSGALLITNENTLHWRITIQILNQNTNRSVQKWHHRQRWSKSVMKFLKCLWRVVTRADDNRVFVEFDGCAGVERGRVVAVRTSQWAARAARAPGADIVLVFGMQSPSLSQARSRFLLFKSSSRFLAVMNGCGYVMQLCPITSSKVGWPFFAVSIPRVLCLLLTFRRL